MGVMGKLKDYPLLVTVLVAGGVGWHYLGYNTLHWLPDVAGAMADFDEAWQVYLGSAGVVAVTAGFASVVIVFALSATTQPFRILRLRGGRRLEANWVSPTAVCLAAAFGSVICAVIAVAGYGQLAWWLFEFLITLSATSGLRLLWLMRTVVKLVRKDDEMHERTENDEAAAKTLTLAQALNEKPKGA